MSPTDYKVRGTLLAPAFTIDRASHERRVSELLAANNREVERRRDATALLREAASTGDIMDSRLASRIETFLSENQA